MSLSLLASIGGFVLSIAALVIGSRLVVERGRTIGIYFDLPPYIIGVLIVAVGTSLPELAANIAATIDGYTHLPVAKAVGANITNVLLVGGVSALLARKIVIEESLEKTELPFFVIALILFLGSAADGVVTGYEGGLLLAVYGIYVVHLLQDGRLSTAPVLEETETQKVLEERRKTGFPHLSVFVWFVVGVFLLVKGADATVASLVHLAKVLHIAPEAVALVALSFGTSLPELAVSIRAAFTGESTLAVGNIIGSSAFNVLGTVGIPALIAPLQVAGITQDIGIPALIAASVILLLLGYAKVWFRWEGAVLLLGYVLFLLLVGSYAASSGTPSSRVFAG